MILLSMVSLILLFFVCLSHVRSQAWTPESPWGTPESPTRDGMDDEDHDSPQSAHVRSRTWIPESPWEAPEDLSGGRRVPYGGGKCR